MVRCRLLSMLMCAPGFLPLTLNTIRSCSIIDDLVEPHQESENQDIHLVYWYFQSGTTESMVVRSILRQLCSAKSPQHKFPQDVRDWLLRNRNSNPQPQTEQFLEQAIRLIKGLRLQIYIILDDGLDEFRPQADEISRASMLKVVSKIFRDASSNLHVLLVSKFEDTTQWYLQETDLRDAVVEVDVKDIMKAELDEFIDLTMKHDESFMFLGEDVQQLIKKRLEEGEDRCVLCMINFCIGLAH